jgi:hypothetical protein
MRLKIGLLAIIFFAGIAVANAQGGFQRRTPEERSKRVVDTLTTVFKLDTAQHSQVQAVFLDYNKASDKLFEGMQGGGARPDRSEFEKLRTQRDEKLQKVLNAEQYKKFKDEIEPAMMQRRQGGGGGRNGGGGGGNRPDNAPAQQ